MDCNCIPYTLVPGSSALYLDYIYNFERAARFYNGNPFAPASYEAAANAVSAIGYQRAELAAILREQNRSFASESSTLHNIERLSEPGTFAVVTGQQAGLFSGPAFTIYKALTAVRLAQSLSDQGLPSVPVFWLATEDHDLDEVANTATLDEEYNLIHLADQGEKPAPRSSVGYVRLTSEVSAAIERLETSLPPGESRERLLADVRSGYQPGTHWGHAFGCFMAKLFSRWGVILVNALDDSLHRLSRNIYKQAIEHAAELRRTLGKRSREMIEAGYHAQVHIADDSTLVFVAPDGNRTPLDQQQEDFLLDGGRKISRDELDSLLDSQPLAFSPNALLRPIVQDSLLPTIAYVAGPSELAYLGQSHSVYPAFGRPMPVIFPRAGFTLIDGRTHRILEKYRLSVGDVLEGEEHLRRRIAAMGFAEGWAERLDQSGQELWRVLEQLRKDIEVIDPTLLDTLKHAQEKISYQVDKLKGKISRAALERNELLTRHQQLLLRFLTPNGDLQEREISGAYFLGRAGYGLLDRILECIPTQASDHQVLHF